MAKQQIDAAAPDHLTMHLFAPGMSASHRAGLGGLACTLKAMERQYKEGRLALSKLPAPFVDDTPPWNIDEQSITLRFGKANKAVDYLKKLFAFAFELKNGIIYLPGQYGDVPPSVNVRVSLQDGLLLSLYDHGPQSRCVQQVDVATVTVDDLPIEYRTARISWYKHQRDGATMAINALTCPQPISRMIMPGAIVRHDKYKQTGICMDATLLIPLLFAPTGTFALRMGAKRVTLRGKRTAKPGAVLFVPDIQQLVDWENVWHLLLPNETKCTRVGSLGDAILSAEVRLRLAGMFDNSVLVRVRAIWCCPTDWNSQLQPPNKVIEVDQKALSPTVLDRYVRALAVLQPRVHQKKDGSHFLADSIIRPLIADNLASGQKWYAGFTRLLTKTNPATDKPYRNQLSSERKGLHDMISDSNMWDQEGESLVVQSVHEAMRQSLGRIKQDTDGPSTKKLSQATKNRWERFREKLRLDLAGAKTPAQLRFALTDLFSRGGHNRVLQKAWEKVLPVIRSDWQLARDLGLLALASYAGRDEADSDLKDESNTKS